MAKDQQPKTSRLQRWRERRRRAKAEQAARIHSLRTADKFDRSSGHDSARHGVGPTGGMGGIL